MKRKEHLIDPHDIELNQWEFRLVMGDHWEGLHEVIHSFFCDCGNDDRILIDYKVYLTDEDDLVLKGKCSSCEGIASVFIETGDCKEKLDAADRIRDSRQKQQEDRINRIFEGVTDNFERCVANFIIYQDYLRNELELPDRVTGIEDFEWEECYVFGHGSKKEYDELKKENPSYTDHFILHGITDEIDDFSGLIASVERISDGKHFEIPLEHLRTIDGKSPNTQLLDDYATWWVNY